MKKINEERCLMCGDPIPEGRMVCCRCENVEPSFDTIKTIVLLDKIECVHEFVNLVSKCNGDVTAGYGRFSVNAKSMMGLFSLDLRKRLMVEFHGDIPYEVIEGMKKFIVK